MLGHRGSLDDSRRRWQGSVSIPNDINCYGLYPRSAQENIEHKTLALSTPQYPLYVVAPYMVRPG